MLCTVVGRPGTYVVHTYVEGFHCCMPYTPAEVRKKVMQAPPIGEERPN